MWNELTSENPVNTTLNNADIIINSDIIFLAIKPQSLVVAIDDAKKAAEGRNLMLENKLFVSVLAGVTLDTLEKVNLFLIIFVFLNFIYMYAGFIFPI